MLEIIFTEDAKFAARLRGAFAWRPGALGLSNTAPQGARARHNCRLQGSGLPTGLMRYQLSLGLQTKSLGSMGVNGKFLLLCLV